MESYSVTLGANAEIWLAPLAALLGLIVGSFLNVVIVRLPRMMQLAWEDACAEVTGQPAPARPRFNLAWPRSHCPACGHPLAWHELVPVFSWLALRGRCAHCAAAIPLRYPLVELATGALFAACAMRFGATAATPAAIGLCAALLALAVIDARTMLLPDAITQPLLWAGLLVNLAAGLFAPLPHAVAGAAAGYGALWLIAAGFHLFTGKEGMGQGDMKLLAALGAWFGWQALPAIVLLASAAGVAAGIAMLLAGRTRRGQPLPFGPYLAAAGIAMLFWPGIALYG